MTTDDRRLSPGASPQFATTRWSVVLSANRPEEPRARQALSDLCEAYWSPLYAFLRRRGSSPQEAEDAVQGFFARLLEKNDLAQVARERGRFRSFLLASLKHFLSNVRNRERALKRGGGQIVSLDVAAAESRYAADASPSAPERLFDRQWALTLLERVRRRLREEFAAEGKLDRFDALASYLTGEEPESFADAATALDLTENAVKVAVHRLRRRYRETLRAEIGETVAGEQEIDEELRDLVRALRGD